MILKPDSWDIWHMPRQRELTVHNHANRLKNKCTFLTPSHGFIFNPQRRKIYNNNTLLYKTYKLSNWKKPLHGMVALCARMPTPIHSSPMLQVNYPFSSLWPPPLPSLPLIYPLDPTSPPTLWHVTSRRQHWHNRIHFCPKQWPCCPTRPISNYMNSVSFCKSDILPFLLRSPNSLLFTFN
jgi:hypothetical protein